MIFFLNLYFIDFLKMVEEINVENFEEKIIFGVDLVEAALK